MLRPPDLGDFVPCVRELASRHSPKCPASIWRCEVEMIMIQRRLFAVLLGLSLLPAAAVLGQNGKTASPNAVPSFQADPSWPKVPNNWVLGPASSIFVDKHDNVWLIERPRSVPAENKERAAPAVVEYDSRGNFVQAWGGRGEGYEWPGTEHGIFVDDKDQVWICGSGVGDHIVLKFTSKGEFLMQIGKQGESKGNSDTKNVNMPADMFVNTRTSELFVADGYGNRRVIVFDSNTGAFKRMWGAYGNTPTGDRPDGPFRGGGGRGARGDGAARGGGGRAAGGGGQPAAAPPAQPNPADLTNPQFDMVHSITMSNDGLLYVVDRTMRRVQIFAADGKYQTQLLVNPEGPSPTHSAVAVVLSPDSAQRLLYVADFGNSQILIVDRKTLKVLDMFGAKGSRPGEFNGLHDVAIDSKGNIYTAEVAPGARYQKFVAMNTKRASN